MMNFFPTPYPDELLYSVFARYHIRSGNTTCISTLNEIFGKYCSSKSVDLPHDMDILVSNMPSNSQYTVEDLVLNHTMFPFYSAFMEEEKTDRILALMKNGQNTRIHLISGAASRTFKTSNCLRFCPACFRENIAEYGEAYWHRIHQISCLFVCPVHAIPLLDSNIFLSTPYSKYYAADEDSCKLYSPGQYNDDIINKLLNLALDTLWLMRNRHNLPDKQNIQKKYISLLFKRGLCSAAGRIFQKKLFEQFLEYYGAAFLTFIHEREFSEQSNWLKGITWDQMEPVHPIAHLLFIRFLSGSIQDFVINRIDSTEQLHKPKTNKNRRITDESKRDDFRKQWLGARDDYPTAGRQKLRTIYPSIYQWLYLHDDQWLFENSPPPLFNVSYNERSNKRSLRRRKKDEEILVKLKNSYEQIVSSQDRPLRITAYLICRKANLQKSIFRSLGSLPKTKEYLRTVTESQQDYIERKIKWAIKYLGEKGKKISRHSIARTAFFDYAKIAPFETLIQNGVVK